jgi:hypothetical protein
LTWYPPLSIATNAAFFLAKREEFVYLGKCVFHEDEIMDSDDLDELILTTEDYFGIEIPLADACAIQTPGALADYVMACVKTNKDAPCLSQARFYRLRALLMEIPGMSRRKIHPATPLAGLMREDALRDFWARLKLPVPNTSAYLPRLELPPAVETSVAAINFWVPLALSLPIMLYPVLKSWDFSFLFLWLCAWLTLCILTFNLTDWLTEHKRVLIPQGLERVAALLPFVEVPNAAWTRETVLERILLVTSFLCSIPADKINEHAHFVEELGME